MHAESSNGRKTDEAAMPEPVRAEGLSGCRHTLIPVECKWCKKSEARVTLHQPRGGTAFNTAVLPDGWSFVPYGEGAEAVAVSCESTECQLSALAHMVVHVTHPTVIS